MAFVFGLQTLYSKDFSKIYQLMGLKPKNKGYTNFYECCDLTKKLYLREVGFHSWKRSISFTYIRSSRAARSISNTSYYTFIAFYFIFSPLFKQKRYWFFLFTFLDMLLFHLYKVLFTASLLLAPAFIIVFHRTTFIQMNT